MNESDQAGRSRDLLSAPHVGVARGARLQHPITPTSAMMSNAIGLIFLVCTQPVCMYTTVHQFAFAEDFRCVRAVIQKTLRADRRPRRDTLTVPCKGLTAPQGQEDRRESQS